MELSLNQVIDQVGKDKGIDRQILVEAMEAALETAAKKMFGAQREIEAQYNEEIGQVELFQYMTVVEEIEEEATEIDIEMAHRVDAEAQVGDEFGFQIFYRDEDGDRALEEDEKYGDILKLRTYRRAFGRIAAQTAKQVILQRVREAERNMVHNEYKDRKGELITGIARRFERGNVIIDLGRAEAVLPLREQTHRESYRAGDRVQAYVLDVQKHAKGPQIVLSRACEGLILKLFEMEVPEIYEGIVEIVRTAREPGERTKVAVRSRDADVDPVGACVGMKGSRVQAVVQELRGEKIDIVPYYEDPARFVCAAIAPAEVSRVLVDEDNGIIELIVPDDQLSLAIGRRGQNVRLAHRLVGYEIKIFSESKIEDLKETLRERLTEAGIDGSLVLYLFKLGFHSADNLLNADESELTAIPGVSLETAQHIQQLAYEHRKALLEEEDRQRNERQAAAAREAAGLVRIPRTVAEPAAEEAATESDAETAADAGSEEQDRAADDDSSDTPPELLAQGPDEVESEEAESGPKADQPTSDAGTE